jgi:hypothetical protein
MNRYLLAVVLGFAGWAIGYLAGIPLLAVPEYIHTAEGLLAAFLGMLFGFVYFSQTGGPYLKEGIRLGVIWLVLMWLLDYLFLLPLMGGDFGAYFASIGLGYIEAPILMTVFGYALDRIGKK